MFTKKPNYLDGVPIYIDKTKLSNYYAESYYLYKAHLNFLVQSINKFATYESSNNRTEYFKKLKTAYSQNANNVNKLVSILKNEVTIDAMESLQINPSDVTETTLKDFIYLRRDWCFFEETEKQLNLTRTVLCSLDAVLAE